MGPEFFRLAVVYVHLIACSVAIGSIVVSDFAVVRQLISGDPYQGQDNEHLQQLQSAVTFALLALWLTGAVIIAIDVAAKGLGYFDNPKLQAKIIIVCLLTLNGVLLHNTVLPMMKKAKSLLRLTWSQAAFALFVGTLSAISWFYAAFLGIGRHLSWKYPLMQLLAPHTALIACAFLGMLSLLAWAKYRTRKPSQRDFDATLVIAY